MNTTTNTMNVLSLFDGISCAYVGLQRAGIKVEKYYASEIDKNAIIISKRHVPCRIDVGDVRTITALDDTIDLLVGGSPCQDLSIAKKGRKGLDGDRSGLFWEYVRIKELINPTYFILENVASMPKADRDIITKTMGVEPILINASLVSAQCRKRLFWTNIPNVNQPVDRGILLKDILQSDAEVDDRMVTKTFTPTAQTGRNETKKLGYIGEVDHQARRVYDANGKLPALNVVCNSMVKVGYIGEGEQYGQGGQAHRVYSPDGKTPTLSSSAPLVKIGRDIGRRLNAEGHREDGNTDIPIQRRIETREDGKCGTLTSVQKDNLVVQENKIRKLTPIECERLQGLPDNYTEGIAMTNRYKVLGNAFNVDVVAHILSNLLV
jgi:DNA (cytosine-5)-methyltransferase 3A